MALLTLVSLTISAQVSLHTPKMTLVLNAENGKAPQYVYFGSRLSNSDLNRLQFPTGGRMDAYPAYGMNCMAEAALALRHADGNMSTELYTTGIDTQKDGNSETVTIHLKDPKYSTKSEKQDALMLFFKMSWLGCICVAPIACKVTDNFV